MKNRILKFITGMMIGLLIFGAISLDSEGTNLPYWFCFISLLWLCPFSYANRDRLEGDDE